MKRIHSDYEVYAEELIDLTAFLEREKFKFGLPTFLPNDHSIPLTGAVLDSTSTLNKLPIYDVHGTMRLPITEETLFAPVVRILRVVSGTRLEQSIDKFYQEHKDERRQ